MTIGFFHDGPMNVDPNGNYHDGVLNDEIITRYLYLGDRIVCVTRIFASADLSENTIIKNKAIEFVNVPNLNTIKGRLFQKDECYAIVKKAVQEQDIIIARLPSYVGSMAVKAAKEMGKNYLTEVVGCPWDSLWNHSYKGKVMAPRAYFALKRTLKSAPFVIYVTNEFLQHRYPTSGKSIGCSDVELPPLDENVLAKRLDRINQMRTQDVITIGTLANVNLKYKGHESVIKALSHLKKRGICKFRYELVGGGDSSRLKKICQKYGVEQEVIFVGPKPHAEVFSWLDGIDIYAQPSKTEGMPRALIEAESRGLPAFGSDAGGIPELLDSRYVFKNQGNTTIQIAEILTYFGREEQIQQAKRNFENAKNYQKQLLDQKRKAFYDEFLEVVR